MTDNLGEAVVVVGADTSGFKREVTTGVDSALANASRSMQQVGTKMQSVGKQLSFSLTAPLVGIGAAAVKTQADFEQTMNILQAATDAPAKAMTRLTDQARQLGADTVFSANDAAEAMLELGRAGFKTAQITKAVPEVINLAATEGLRLGDAAGIVSSALSQFSLKANQAGQVVNALAGASNASRASVATLSESLKLVGSAAAGIGLSVQETAGALAALADSGLDGSIAGTSLASVFNHLVPQTEKASTAMKKLRLDFTDAEGNFDSMTTIAGKLQTAFKDMDDESRKIALSRIFGKDASVIAAVNALIKSGSKGLKEYTEAAQDQNAASKLAEARMKGLGGAIEKMKGSLETAGLALGQALAPAVTKVAGVVNDLADGFTKLPESAQTTIAVIGAAAAAAGPLLFVVGGLTRGLGTMGLALSATSTGLTTFATNMTTATGRAAIMQGTMAKLGATAKVAAGIGGIAALTAATQEADTSMASFQKIAGGALTGFAAGGPWGAAIGVAVGGFMAIRGELDRLKEKSKQAAFANQSLLDQANALKKTNYEYADSLNAVTGALTRKTREQARDNLVADGTLEAARTIGLSTRDLVAAATGNVAATERVTKAYKRLYNEALNTGNLATVTATKSAFDQISESLHVNSAAVAENRRAIRERNSDLLTMRQALKGLDKEVFLRLKADGFAPSIKQLRSLKEQFDLTPKELRLIVKETGSEAVITKAGNIRRALDDVGKAKPDLGLFMGGVTRATDESLNTSLKAANGIRKNLLLNDVRANMAQLVPSVRDAMGKAGDAANAGGQSIGNQLESGLLTGFASAKAALAAQMQSTVVTAIRRAHEVAQIASPSKKTRYVGRMMGAGLAVGLSGSERSVLSASDRLMQAAMPTGGHLSVPVRGSVASVGASPVPTTTPTTYAPQNGVQGQGPLVEQNFYGPTTGADRLQEMDWALRFATGRTPVQVTAGGAG